MEICNKKPLHSSVKLVPKLRAETVLRINTTKIIPMYDLFKKAHEHIHYSREYRNENG